MSVVPMGALTIGALLLALGLSSSTKRRKRRDGDDGYSSVSGNDSADAPMVAGGGGWRRV